MDDPADRDTEPTAEGADAEASPEPTQGLGDDTPPADPASLHSPGAQGTAAPVAAPGPRDLAAEAGARRADWAMWIAVGALVSLVFPFPIVTLVLGLVAVVFALRARGVAAVLSEGSRRRARLGLVLGGIALLLTAANVGVGAYCLQNPEEGVCPTLLPDPPLEGDAPGDGDEPPTDGGNATTDPDTASGNRRLPETAPQPSGGPHPWMARGGGTPADGAAKKVL